MDPDCSECKYLAKLVRPEHITHTDPAHHHVECPNIAEGCEH